jgi:hypothetical protein
MTAAQDTIRSTEETRAHRFIKLVGIASATALAFAIGPVTFAEAPADGPATELTAGGSAHSAAGDANAGALVTESRHRTFGIKPKPMPKPMPQPIPKPVAKPKPTPDQGHKGNPESEAYPWVLAEPLEVDTGGLSAKTDADTVTARKRDENAKQFTARGHGQFLAKDTGATQAAVTGPSLEHGIFFDDCNSNGISDMQEVEADGEDVDENGMLDSCQMAAGDLDLDGITGSRDLVMVLMHWQSTESLRDLNSDGVVDSADLGILLSNWSENL